jgi:hypothetical protein
MWDAAVRAQSLLAERVLPALLQRGGGPGNAHG